MTATGWREGESLIADSVLEYALSPRTDNAVDLAGWLAWYVLWFYIKKPEPAPRYADLARRMQIAALRRSTFRRVYRGVALTGSKIRYTLQPGMTYTLDCLTSATPDRNVALLFTGGVEKAPVLLRFEDRQGVRCARVELDREPEVVLPRGAAYVVRRTRRLERAGLTVVHLAAIDADDNRP